MGYLYLIYRHRYMAISSVVCVMSFLIWPTQSAWANSCLGGANYYAGVVANVGNQWGTGGYIQSYNITVPSKDGDFSDQAEHSGVYEDGLEVGWYVGLGEQTGAYVTSPHAYATQDGYAEVDGPSVGTNSDYLYRTWWAGDTQGWIVANTSTGTYIWEDSQGTTYAGPADVLATGETSNQSLSMEGAYTSLQDYSCTLEGGCSWPDWTALTCWGADSPYAVGGISVDAFEDN
jgi:hypothetical protein